MSDQTPNAVVQRALARRQELEEELRKLDTFLEVWRNLEGADTSINAATVVTDTSNPTSGTNGAESNQPRTRDAGRAASGISQADFVKLVREILLEGGRPSQPEIILEEMHNKGRHAGGAKEWENFKTKLWRAKQAGKFVVIPGAGYWPPDIACPAVQYEPPNGGDHL